MLSSEYIYGTGCCPICISVRAADEILPTSSVAFVLIIIITHLSPPPTTVFLIFIIIIFTPFIRPILPIFPSFFSFWVSCSTRNTVFLRGVNCSRLRRPSRQLLPSFVAVIVVFNIIEFNPDDAPSSSSLPLPLPLLLLLLLQLLLLLLLLYDIIFDKVLQ